MKKCIPGTTDKSNSLAYNQKENEKVLSTGLEPMTFALSERRATNCATRAVLRYLIQNAWVYIHYRLINSETHSAFGPIGPGIQNSGHCA